MRKHQQRQILELLKTIDEAQANGLYADCQDVILEVGEFIEQIEGDATQTVALLEEYCELLFRASNGEISEKQLRKHMIKIENSVKTELKPKRIEVVFLPYKISMWDSLESIYHKAVEDPSCDAYVVPIPLYEINPDGSFGKLYYDGDQYPDEVPIYDWQKFDIESHHPDVIFIHYEYDDNANNARIHPDFYSRILRKYCELLVYVPYFVIIGDAVPEYYGYMPGVINSHRVIVQTDAYRQSYIELYKKSDKDNGWQGRYGKAEEKFIALGNPKFDKVINTKPEDCTLPDKWRQLVNKPDGTRKRIVLLNTHMFRWLEGGETYFKKLYSIFESFQNRKDAVLWWRPHPNTELNFRVKRPQWLDAYLTITGEYKSGGWGIYDDTFDLHRAIAASEAYYGDWSSLVALFGMTGKPIIIHDINIEGCERIDKLFEDPGNPTSSNDKLAIMDYIISETSDAVVALSEDGTIDGQKEAFSTLTKIADGTSGAHIYKYVKDQVLS